MKRKRRSWVFLPNHTRQEFNIYTDGNPVYDCIKWNGKWYYVIYRPEYGEYEIIGEV